VNNDMFTVTDPLGRGVVLKSSTWHDKIIAAGGHQDVGIYLDEIRELASNPYYILNDLILDPKNPEVDIPHPSRQEYVDLIPSKTKPRFVGLKIVVDHSTDPGEIVTAHLFKKISDLRTEGGIVYVRPRNGKS